MKLFTSLLIAFFIASTANCQDNKELLDKIEKLELKVNNLEKIIVSLQKSIGNTNNKIESFEIRYEMESDDKNSDFLITFWDKGGESNGGWFKSGWKYSFSTSDLNQQINIRASSALSSKKSVTLKIFVNNKLVKSDSKSMFTQLDGPYCQVILSDL